MPMRKIAIALAASIFVLSVLALIPGVLTSSAGILHVAIAVAALLTVGAILADHTKNDPARATAETRSPAIAAPIANQANSEVINFLAILQERGRFVDFLMDDITAYSDAQVGAAGRVLHGGCKAVLLEHFGIRAMRDEDEGSTVTVPTGYAPDDYRLVGKISGEAPFTGTLVHHGWRVEWVKLPRLLRASDDRLPAIAPAEVELR